MPVSDGLLLAGGVGKGISSLLDSYQRSRQLTNEEERAKRDDRLRGTQLGLLAQKEGFLLDPDTGTVTESDIGRSKRERDAEKAAAELGLMQSQTEENRAKAKLYGRKGGLLGDIDGGTKQLPAEGAERIAGSDTALTTLADVEDTFSKNGDAIGPIVGRFRGLLPYDTTAKKLAGKSKAAAQIIGKALEGGKLTDQDILRYEAMLPTTKDTPDVAAGKIENIRGMIQARRANDIASYKKAGFKVGSYGTGVSVPPPPKIDPKIQQALDLGYTMEEINAHLGN